MRYTSCLPEFIFLPPFCLQLVLHLFVVLLAYSPRLPRTVCAVISNKINMCSERARGKAIAEASEYKSSTFHYAINPIFSLVAYLSASSPRRSSLSRPFSIIFPLPNSALLSLSSPPEPATTLPVTNLPSLPLLHACLPACLPSFLVPSLPSQADNT